MLQHRVFPWIRHPFVALTGPLDSSAESGRINIAVCSGVFHRRARHHPQVSIHTSDRLLFGPSTKQLEHPTVKLKVKLITHTQDKDLPVALPRIRSPEPNTVLSVHPGMEGPLSLV